MNKKMVVFLVLALAALSVMAISVWGTLAENNDLPPVNELIITDFDAENIAHDKIIFVKDVITTDHYYYDVYFQINPSLAERDIKATLNVAVGDLVVDGNLSFVRVVYDYDKIGQSVTVTIWDAKTMVSDSVILLFRTSGEVDVDDPDVFD
jgi:hypothetical protein